MATDPQALTLEAGDWAPDAEIWLAQALASATLDDLRRQWEQGAQLFRVKHQGSTVGAFLLRVDQTARGPQGVIVAAAAALQGVDMIDTCMPAIESMFKGVRSIRYHTKQPALARKMARIGYQASEIICIKDVTT